MSPSTYYCWLYERPLMWLGLRRWQPRSDQGFPAVAALIGPLAIGGLFMLPLAVLDVLSRSTSDKTAPTVLYLILGVVGLACGVVHSGFAWLTWNQRAARQRAAGTATPAPRPAWFIRWLLGPFYLFVIGLVTPLALLIAVENVRGALAWKRVRTDLQANGERLFLREVVPPPVPAEQNFASLPIFANLFDYGPPVRGGVGGVQWADTNAMNRFNVFHLPDGNLPKRERGSDSEGTRPVSLADWAVAFRTAISNQTAEASGTRKRSEQNSLPKYPAVAANADEARVVLTALSVAETEFAAICEASHRPYTRFPVHWDEGFSALLPHLAKFKSLSRFASIRAQARLAAGDVAGAFADAQCGFRLAGALREEPFLISQLVRFAQEAIAAQTVWHGIAAHRWADAQLQEFQRHLSQADYLRDLAMALEGERSGSLSVMDRWATSARQLREEASALGITDSADIPQGIAASSAGTPMFPRGWIRQNQAALATGLQLRIEQTRRLATNAHAQGFADALREFNADADGERALISARTSPYNIFVKLLLPALDKAMLKGARANQTARMAAAGCALERHRLKHGSYPESLAALVPEFVPEIPRDLMDGQPLRYARTDEGLFRLWSVGDDGKDNGGKRAANNQVVDWAWPY
jgi:hypothetical protein